MQSADLLAGKEGTADPTELIELIEDLAELKEAGAVADAAADARDVLDAQRCSRARPQQEVLQPPGPGQVRFLCVFTLLSRGAWYLDRAKAVCACLPVLSPNHIPTPSSLRTQFLLTSGIPSSLISIMSSDFLF
jgi:hypothetical protein